MRFQERDMQCAPTVTGINLTSETTKPSHRNMYRPILSIRGSALSYCLEVGCDSSLTETDRDLLHLLCRDSDKLVVVVNVVVNAQYVHRFRGPAAVRLRREWIS